MLCGAWYAIGMYPANEAKFWARVQETDGCWEWGGRRTRQGYGHGSWHIDGKLVQLAHRVSYMLRVGPIPDGLVIDHLCRNPPCVRPDHLEPVLPYVNNVVRGHHWRAERTVCDNGHEFTPENTYQRPDRPKQRQCRACMREAGRRFAQAHRDQRNEKKRQVRAAQLQQPAQ